MDIENCSAQSLGFRVLIGAGHDTYYGSLEYQACPALNGVLSDYCRDIPDISNEVF